MNLIGLLILLVAGLTIGLVLVYLGARRTLRGFRMMHSAKGVRRV